MSQEIQNSVMAYLKEEGFAPSIDEDGDIRFKKEGDLYYVIIDDKEDNPYYMSIALARGMDEGYNMQKAISIAYEVQEYKGVKMKLYNTSILTKSEMFFQDPKHFNAVFYRTTRILLAAMNEFCEKFF